MTLRLLACFVAFTLDLGAQTALQKTSPLAVSTGDRSAEMIAGIASWAERQTQAMRQARLASWQQPGHSIDASRQRLQRMIGAQDPRLPVKPLELVGDVDNPALVLDHAVATVQRVRWEVMPGAYGEGLLISPKAKPRARVIYLPDADTLPKELVDAGLLHCGCEVIIPTLISRSAEGSKSDLLQKATNLPHREWIYRQAYESGHHVIGYEVQQVMALMDRANPNLPTLIAGLGEGGLIALHAAAIDTRINAAYIWGYFGPRDDLWQEPIYRNIAGLLREFGDAEIAAMIAPRPLVIHHLGFPNVQGPPAAVSPQRAVAAPGRIVKPSLAAVHAEAARARSLAEAPQGWLTVFTDQHGLADAVPVLLPATVADAVIADYQAHITEPAPVAAKANALTRTRQLKLVAGWSAHSQAVLDRSEDVRQRDFWQPLKVADPQALTRQLAGHRQRFWADTIGKMPDPNVSMNARSRVVSEDDAVVIHEILIDVWQGIPTWAWMAVPKNLANNQRRPVVVCQHGLEGLPEDCFDANEEGKPWRYYKAFALRLAERGYITVAPHNAYRGGDAFRSLQRRLNPLGLSLFSVIIGQHQRLLEWLATQSYVDAQRIGFYGLSYGGKSAMRIPAVLPGYCLSICSGDFNEWVRKNASTTMPMSYVFTPEYEIWEWDMAHSYSYAEMAALISPRPFMVERGHADGVGSDEWVNYEFAKVRRFYNRCGIGEKTEIEHFDGPHTIHGEGSFRFLDRWLPVGR
jgi:cephalosporin-C deacetylase-like acetyl esterase